MSRNYTINNLQNYSLNIDVNINDVAWESALDNLDDLLVKVSSYVFDKLKLSKNASNIEFSIILTDNEEIQKLNAQYRNKNVPTNCLSFPTQAIEITKIEEYPFYGGFAILGDIIFAYKKIKDESIEQKKNFLDHFIHLLVHSILHLLGYDHEVEKEALEMERLEIDILSFFNISSPYETLD